MLPEVSSGASCSMKENQHAALFAVAGQMEAAAVSPCGRHLGVCVKYSNNKLISLQIWDSSDYAHPRQVSSISTASTNTASQTQLRFLKNRSLLMCNLQDSKCCQILLWQPGQQPSTWICVHLSFAASCLSPMVDTNSILAGGAEATLASIKFLPVPTLEGDMLQERIFTKDLSTASSEIVYIAEPHSNLIVTCLSDGAVALWDYSLNKLISCHMSSEYQFRKALPLSTDLQIPNPSKVLNGLRLMLVGQPRKADRVRPAHILTGVLSTKALESYLVCTPQDMSDVVVSFHAMAFTNGKGLIWIRREVNQVSIIQVIDLAHAAKLEELNEVDGILMLSYRNSSGQYCQLRLHD